MQEVRSNTTEKSELLILHVYDGPEDTAFDYYTDDGATFAYQQGQYHKRRIEFKARTRTLVLRKSEGAYVTPIQKLRIVVHGLVSTTGNWLPAINQFVQGLEKFDPIYDPEPAPQENVHTIELPYSTEEISLSW